jgi:MFS family permease
LATGNLGLKFAPREHATSYLAVASLVSAAAGGVTPIVAGYVAEWFAAHKLSIVLPWVSHSGTRDVSFLSFGHWEFLFALSALIGLFVMHTLFRIKEGPEVSERRVVPELALQTIRTISNLSSAGGALALHFQIGPTVSSSHTADHEPQAAHHPARPPS